MNRISRTTMRRLSPRATVISGAALGLIAGATVYGAVSSSADPASHSAFKAAPKAPVAAAAKFAGCKTGAKLEKGVCVVHVVRTVTEAPTAAQKAKWAQVTGSIPGNTLKQTGENAGKATSAEAKEKEGAAADKAADAKAKAKAKAKVTAPAPAPVPVPVPVATPAPTKAPVPTPTPTATAKPTTTPTPAPSAAS
jgi:hypothetical protein